MCSNRKNEYLLEKRKKWYVTERKLRKVSLLLKITFLLEQCLKLLTWELLVVEEGSVLSMGCAYGQSTKIINRANGEITKGRIPPYSVVVPGSHKDLYAVHIIKTVDSKQGQKLQLTIF